MSFERSLENGPKRLEGGSVLEVLGVLGSGGLGGSLSLSIYIYIYTYTSRGGEGGVAQEWGGSPGEVPEREVPEREIPERERERERERLGKEGRSKIVKNRYEFL